MSLSTAYAKKWWETDDLGRFCNHSIKPNTSVIYYPDKLELKAIRLIEEGEEILVNYMETIKYIKHIPTVNF